MADLKEEDQGVHFDVAAVEMFHNGNYSKASKATKEAWLLFVGQFLVACNHHWQAQYANHPDQFTVYNYCAEEAHVLMVIKNYVPLWDKYGFKKEAESHQGQEKVQTSATESADSGKAMDSSDDHHGDQKEEKTKRETIRTEKTTDDLVMEYADLMRSISDSRYAKVSHGKSWDQAFAKWYKKADDDERARILGTVKKSSGSKRKRGKVQNKKKHVFIPVELFEDERMPQSEDDSSEDGSTDNSNDNNNNNNEAEED